MSCEQKKTTLSRTATWALLQEALPVAGADAIAIAEQKVADLQQQINAYRDLSTSLAVEERSP